MSLWMRQRTRQVPPKQQRKRRQFLQRFLWLARVFLSFIFIGLISFGLHYLFVTSSMFKIRDVVVQGESHFVDFVDLHNIAAEHVVGKSIFSLDATQLSLLLRRVFQGAYQIDVSKKFPHTLIIRVYERSPVAFLFNDSSTDLFVIDKDGYVLGISSEETLSLPKIYYASDIRVGYFIEASVVPLYLEMIDATSATNLRVSSMSFYPSYVLFYVDNGIEILVSNSKNKKYCVQIVAALIRKLTAEQKDVKKIDLRYDKVIVSY